MWCQLQLYAHNFFFLFKLVQTGLMLKFPSEPRQCHSLFWQNAFILNKFSVCNQISRIAARGFQHMSSTRPALPVLAQLDEWTRSTIVYRTFYGIRYEVSIYILHCSKLKKILKQLKIFPIITRDTLIYVVSKAKQLSFSLLYGLISFKSFLSLLELIQTNYEQFSRALLNINTFLTNKVR